MEKKSFVKVGHISGFPEWLPGKRIIEEGLITRIKNQFSLYGFAPIETSAVERWDVLTAKGGIQKQIFAVTNKKTVDEFEYGLHFDLTVPLARYVAQNHDKLIFPFRRYQIQKVWRGERAQKGRFREFLQCDIDIIGYKKLNYIYDAEIPCVINSVFENINTIPDLVIYINNRKLIDGLCKDFEIEGKIQTILTIIDNSKLDIAFIKNELKAAAVKEGFIKIFLDFVEKELDCAMSGESIIKEYSNAYIGYKEIFSILEASKALGMPDGKMVFNPLIVRGLDYYTGTVFETFIKGKENWGSISSGGRYDDLATYFSNHIYPGVGMSIGLTRLIDLLFTDEYLKTKSHTYSNVIITTLQKSEYLKDYLALGRYLREGGIPSEIFLEDAPLREQLAYASNKKIRFAIIAGGDEFTQDVLKVKDLEHHSEETIRKNSLLTYIKSKIDK